MVPLMVQNTIFNTAPFWASLLGYCFAGESITRFEGLAILLSFGGVILIAFSNSNKNDVHLETISLNKQLLGSFLVFVTSWCFAIVTNLTR